LAELAKYTGGAHNSVIQFVGTEGERYLKAKNHHFETLVERLERERTEL
jgi:hypothetical protein